MAEPKDPILPSRSNRHPRLAMVACGLVALVAAGSAQAQPAGDAGAPSPQQQIDDAVAAALFDRGQLLFAQRDYQNAKVMFIESLERSSSGLVADKALAMLRASNERLGIKDLESGAPDLGKLPDANQPLDPYGDGGQGPLDPYGDGGQGPLDPYGDGGQGPGGSGGGSDPDAVPVDPYGDGGGTGTGGGSTSAGGDQTTGWTGRQARNYSMLAGAGWGALSFAMLGDMVSGVGTSSGGEVFGYALAGAAVGAGAGYLYGKKVVPSAGDLAFINSFGAYGTAAALFIGVAIDPVESEAYSLNGVFGIAAGLGAGFYLATRVDPSPRRMMWVDLGAAGGVAATWALLYPLLADQTTNDDEQTAGVVSIAAMGGGAYLMWWLTRKMDKHLPPDPLPGEMPVASLVTRDSRGRWGRGVPMLRPMENPALAPPTGSMSLGLDLVGGRF